MRRVAMFVLVLGVGLGVYMVTVDAVLSFAGARGYAVPPIHLLIAVVAVAIIMRRSEAVGYPDSGSRRVVLRIAAALLAAVVAAATAAVMISMIPGYFEWADRMHVEGLTLRGADAEAIARRRVETLQSAITAWLVITAVVGTLGATATLGKRTQPRTP